MSNKHYEEQKMLIENFRKWREDDEQEVIQEGLGDIIQYLAISTGTLYMLGPYLKIAVHHPDVQAALTGGDTESGVMFRTMAEGLKAADNAGQWLQDYADDILDPDAGIFSRVRNAVALFTFLVVLFASGFPVGGSMIVRALPRLSMFIKKTYLSTKKKAKEIKARVAGEPTPDQLEIIDREIEELEALEEEKTKAQQLAIPVADVIEMIRQDPERMAAEMGVKLSAEDLRNMKVDPVDAEETPIRRSNRMKLDIPSSRGSSNED